MPIGHTQTTETRKKISNSLKGSIPWNKGKTNIYTKEVLEKISQAAKGERNHRWNPNRSSYRVLHYWVEEHKGKASICESKDETCSNHFEWSNISHEYKRILDDFQSLCVSHHRRYDKAWRNNYVTTS